MSIEKVYYRPYLTGENLDSLVELISQHPHTAFIKNMPLLDAYKKLNDLKEKKDRGIAFKALVTKGSIKEQLKQGLDLDEQSAQKPRQLTPLEKRAAAWNKFQSNPANCSPEEIELVQTYRWENELMGEEEKMQYEAKQFGGEFNF